MHVYVDESGPFIPLDRQKERVSVVGALVLPTYGLPDILGEYLAIRPELSFRDGEPKGAAQSETQVARVLRMLSSHDAVFDMTCIDTGQHDLKSIEGFRDRQATMLFADLPDTESAANRQIVYGLRDTMRSLSPQLFVQCMLYMDVVESVLKLGTLYYVQRDPRELGELAWMVDQKDDRLTAVEMLWSDLIRPVLQSKGEQSPFPYIEGADYSYFSRYEMEHPRFPGETVVDLRAVFERLDFRNSRDELGLELADITVSALARALNGSLQRPGWEALGELIIYKKPQSVRFVRLSPQDEDQGIVHERRSLQAEVVEALESGNKSMLSDANLRIVLNQRAP